MLRKKLMKDVQHLLTENYKTLLKGMKEDLNRWKGRTSLVGQWLRICLPMQRTQV